MEAKKVLEIAIEAGQMLLINGAEAYRVEETIEKICGSYGLKCECMTISTGILVSIIDGEDEKITSIKRIKQRGIDLHKIELINAFSRELQKNPLDYEAAKNRLNEISNAPVFSYKIRLLSAAMTSFVYTLFFNGSIYDAIVSTFIGFGIYIIQENISKLGFFQFFQFFFSGFIIGGISILIGLFLPFVNENNVIAGSIMILTPGVAITNGIKDTLYGDFISGIAKLGEAILIICALGVGIGTALSLGRGVSLW